MMEPILINVEKYISWLEKYIDEVKIQSIEHIYVEVKNIQEVKKGKILIFYVDVTVSPKSESRIFGGNPFLIKDGDFFSLNGLECQCMFVSAPLSFTLAFLETPEKIQNGKLSRIDPTRNIYEQINILKNIQNYGLLSNILLNDYEPQKINYQSIELKKFNKYQNEAIEKAVNSEDFFLIHGPPGTGKTTAIVEIIYQLISQGKRVLLTAWTNAAIDNALEKLVETKIIDDDKIVRVGASGLKLSNGIQHLMWKNKNSYFGVQVVGSTLASCYKAKDVIGDLFDVVIVDESGASTLPATLLGLTQGKKFILVGDHYQLPPIVQNYAPKTAKESLFEKMIRKWPLQSVTLKEQYRMNKEISDFLSRYMYRREGGIETSINVQKRISHLPSKIENSIEEKICSKNYPLLWVDSTGNIEWDEHHRTAWNKEEAALTLHIYNLIKKYIPLENIGIITTYRRQRALLKNALRSDILKGLDVSTIDSFQGREKDVIIISFVQFKKTRALSDERKINVALSRAKDKVIIVADDRLMEKGIEIFENLWGYLDGITNKKIIRGIITPKTYLEKIEHSAMSRNNKSKHALTNNINAHNNNYTNDECQVLKKLHERKNKL